MKKFINVERSEISHNGQVKVYPDGSCLVSVYSLPILREPGWEESAPSNPIQPGSSAGSVARSKRRARSSVMDLAMSNDFAYFVTLTLDSSKVNRYSVVEVTKKLNRWLDNRVRRNGLKYILVPELHKDGAIHFHGFINDALSVVDSGTISQGGGKPKKPRSARQRAAWLAQGGHIVYNLPAWSLGFSTAIELYGERRRAINYVCKYITKADDKIGGRWYYSGGDLQRPEVLLFDVDDYESLFGEHGDEFTVPGIGCRGVRFWMEGAENDRLGTIGGQRGGPGESCFVAGTGAAID